MKTMEPETKRPMSVLEKVDALYAHNPEMQVYALLSSPKTGRCEGIDDENPQVVGVSDTYEGMWHHAGEILHTSKDEMRKQGYVFDHVPLKKVRKHVAV